MKIKNKILILVIGSVIGIFYSLYLLYSKKGYLNTSDYIAFSITSLFVIGLDYYFINKWKKEEIE